MLKMVDDTGIIGVDMVCPLGGIVSPPQPPNYDKIEMEGVGSLMLPNSLKAPLERLELIGNSTQGENPAPDNPQEIKSAGRKSRNLFDITKLKKGAGANYPTEIELVGETLIAKKDGGTANQMTFEIELENLEPNTTYEFTTKQIICKRKDSDTEKAGTIFSFKAYKNESQIENKGNVFTTGESESDIYKIIFSVIAGDFGSLEYVKIEQPMLSHSGGSYEPYSDKYKIDIKVTGKNLFNLTDNYIWGWFASHQTQISLYNENAVVYMPCKPNTTYTIYGRTNINGNNNVKNRVATANDFPAEGTKLHNITETQLSNPVTITTDELSKYLVIMAVTDNECNINTREQVLKQNVSKMMVIIGNTPTPYEPYTEQTLTLTSDRPITKWDKLVEQGGSMGWLYSGKIAKEFTFVSKASDENISGRIRRRFKTSLNGKFPQTDKVMCNFLTTDNVRNDYSIGIVGSGDIYIYFYENTGVETLEQANHWLKNLPFEKTIIFERKTTEFVPLSESEQTQLRNLHSYIGTTNIMVDSGEIPCGIKLTYRKEK